MNLSKENMRRISDLIESGSIISRDDIKDLLGHNEHLTLLLEARSRLMLGVEIERDQLKAENAALRKESLSIDPVGGDQLPAIGSKVLIHLSSCDAWIEHTVVGYYAWGDLDANEHLHRVFIRVRDADGCLNARLLKDVRTYKAMSKEG